MSRRKTEDYSRDIGVDPRYSSPLIQKLINTIMLSGKKNVARSIVYGAIDEIIKRNKGDDKKALELFQKSFAQITPVVEVRSRRVGASVYQIPVEVPHKRAKALALRWLIDSAASRSDKTMSLRLAYELMDAAEGRGGAVKKRSDVQRMAEANRAFAHFAW